MGNCSSSDHSSHEIERKTNEIVQAQKREMNCIYRESLQEIREKEAQAREEIAFQANATQVLGRISDRILTEHKIQSDLRLAQQCIVSDAEIKVAEIEGDYNRKIARISTDLEKFQTSRLSKYEREKDNKIAELMLHLRKSQLECLNAEHKTKVLVEESDHLKKELEHKRILKAQKADAMEATRKVDDDYRKKMRHIVKRPKRLASKDDDCSRKRPKELLTKLSAHFAQSRDGEDDDSLAADITASCQKKCSGC